MLLYDKENDSGNKIHTAREFGLGSVIGDLDNARNRLALPTEDEMSAVLGNRDISILWNC